MKKRRRKRLFKINKISIALGLSIMIGLISYEAYKSTSPAETNMTYTEFIESVETGEISYINIIKTQDIFTATKHDGKQYSVINPGHDTFKAELLEKGVEIQVSKQTGIEAVSSVLGTLPIIGLVFLVIFYLSKTLVIGTSTLFKILKNEELVSFDDVAGMTESKNEVMFAVEQLKNRKKLSSIGAIPTKGIILEGPPGTGKTMLAKAIAGEADVPFISTSGSDFIEVFGGLGAARVRTLWELAETNAPCVLFIDEIDAVGRRRSNGGDGLAMESNQTLNALLQKMDGIGSNLGVFVVAATNRVSDLDPALLRPGRFDKQLFIGPPKSKKDRDEIINVHLKGKTLGYGVTVDSISKLMYGMSGAEIAQVLNESVLISLQKGRDGIVEIQDVDEASMKLRASGIITTHSSEKDRSTVAVHEAGHAVISCILGRKVSKVSIVPYSSGIGGVTVEDTDDIDGKSLKSESDILGDIKVLLAGKVSEEILIGECTNGSSNDIEKASILAYNFVSNYGMYNGIILNTDIISKSINTIVDNKKYIESANNLMLDQMEIVRDIVKDNIEVIKELVEELLEFETVIDYNIIV